MKLVLDFVFNHCGKRAGMVQEALQDKESPKRKFFFMGDDYKHGYKAPCLEILYIYISIFMNL